MQHETTTWSGEMADRMEITEDHVTILHTQVVMYEDGPECPCCGRPRVWRQTPEGMVCGTGEDAGRLMRPDEDCWACRSSLAGLRGQGSEVDPVIRPRRG
jgi:hypothetical protein